jgi:pyruvate ferredoxin oxidoreductase delta subunit
MTPAKKNPAEAKPTRSAAKAKPKESAAKQACEQPKLPKPEWDVCDVNEWGPEEHQLGATIPEAGNSIYNETGGWRSQVPQIDSEKCDGCLLCYFYCPDASIIIECGKAAGVDLAHCKGCGICAKECPQKAIVMKPEEKE